jgi:hypothetical protein
MPGVGYAQRARATGTVDRRLGIAGGSASASRVRIVQLGTGTDTPPSGSSPLPAACVAQDAGQACITQIAAQVQRRATLLADGATVTHDHVVAAVGPIAEAVREIPSGAGYELRTKLEDADAEAKATTPLLMSWQVGTATQDRWACFHEGGVTVSASPCDR